MTCSRILVTTLLVLSLLLGCVAAPVYRGPTTANFDGKYFHNRDTVERGFRDMVKLGWAFATTAQAWPAWVEIIPGRVPQDRLANGISVTFINHATTLVQTDGLNILTDPIYADRASPFSFSGPKRVHDPGISLADLPHIDVILVSHNHYDHLDQQTLVALAERQGKPPVIVTGLGNAALLSQFGLTGHHELDWGDKLAFGDITVTFTECRHRSGRGITDQMTTLWGSFVVEAPSGNVYFAGDTGYDEHFKAARAQYRSFELAILPIGAYEPRWFMKDIHLNPAEAVQAHRELNARHSLGIHYGTFQLTLEGISDPETALRTALDEQQVSAEAFWTLRPGESRRIR